MQDIMFNPNLVKAGDNIFIAGDYGEDGIIGYDIARRWKNVIVNRFGDDKDAELSKQWESDDYNTVLQTRIVGQIPQPVIRKEGHVYISLGGNMNPRDEY